MHADPRTLTPGLLHLSAPRQARGHFQPLGVLVEHSIFRACAESLASENASRLAAMQRAEQNIDELLGHLRGTFQRVRQSSIDEELFDVISGFEALSDG